MTARIITDSRGTACAAHSIGGRIPSGAAAPALFHLGERELAVAHTDADAVARSELSLEDLLRQRILDLLLDGPLQRSGAIHRIEAGLPEAVAGGIVEHQVHVALGQALAEVEELDVDDGADLLRAEGMEDYDVVDAVDELGPEALLHDLHHRALHLRVVLLARVLLNDLREELHEDEERGDGDREIGRAHV